MGLAVARGETPAGSGAGLDLFLGPDGQRAYGGYWTNYPFYLRRGDA